MTHFIRCYADGPCQESGGRNSIRRREVQNEAEISFAGGTVCAQKILTIIQIIRIHEYIQQGLGTQVHYGKVVLIYHQ